MVCDAGTAAQGQRMTYTTEITIQRDTFTVEWEGFADVLIPENKSIFDCHINTCPEEFLTKYGEGIILYECCAVEEEIAQEKQIERRLNI